MPNTTRRTFLATLLSLPIVGRLVRPKPKFFTAIVVNAKVWNRALANEKIRAEHRALLHWKLNETSGTQTIDLSNNSRHGTYYG